MSSNILADNSSNENNKKIYPNKQYANKQKSKKKIFCGNCGKLGHIYKQCTEPITSLGILLYRDGPHGRQYLLIMRKDSLGYVEVIRGNYPLDDLEYLKAIIEEMTISEKHKILNYPFERLWSELWVEDEEKKNKYKKEFINSMKYFNKLQEGIEINGELITLRRLVLESISKWDVPEWGFPKGRRNLKEKDLDCALREFEEETDISRKDIFVIKCIPPIEELFVGSNKKKYLHKYYIAKLTNENLEIGINANKKLQLIEIGDIQWFSLSTSLKKIRSYNREKKNVLREADQIIDSIEAVETFDSLEYNF